jgi:type II secretory pathway predicted ATPase ExeA
MKELKRALPKSALIANSATKADAMYEASFHLQKRPFSTIPDPNCFFAPEPIQERFDELILRAESGQGISILTAAAGTGKTLLCRRISAELADRFTPVFLANANFPTRRALLQCILFELKKRFSGLEEQELRLAVYASLRELALAGRGMVLIVDEAHLLSERLLEELRMLACLAEGDQPLARLILAGQAALEEQLAEPALEALNQRIVCHAYLEPLTQQQSIEYIEFRIAWAGGTCSQVFSRGALNRIAAACNGLPRCLNQLCDHVLLLTYVQDLPQVTEQAVDEALLDLKQLPLHWNTPIAAETPFAALNGQSMSAGDELNDDDIEPSPPTLEAVEDLPAEAGQGETICIEIGGTVSETDPVTIATSPGGAPDRSGVSAPPADWQELAEEWIDDRYAALDVRSPQFIRTFEDSAVPENWRTPHDAAASVAPLPPAPPVGSQTEDELLADSLSILAETANKHTIRDGSVEVVSEYVPFASLDSGSRLTADCVEPDRRPTEEQLGASILDTCREVQTTIGNWQSADGTVNSVDLGHGSIGNDEDLILPVPNGEYDIVEPNRTSNVTDVHDATYEVAPAGSRSAGRYVPKPKYRHVFSTLRRRLGRSLNRKG